MKSRVLLNIGSVQLMSARMKPVGKPALGVKESCSAIARFMRNGKGKCLELRPLGGSEKPLIVAMSHGGDSLQLGEMVE